MVSAGKRIPIAHFVSIINLKNWRMKNQFIPIKMPRSFSRPSNVNKIVPATADKEKISIDKVSVPLISGLVPNGHWERPCYVA